MLRGELVELRPLRADDRDALYEVASDPLIWEQHPEPDRCEPEVFDRYFADQLDSGGALVVVDRRTGRIAGVSRYHAYDPLERTVEIGWTFLAREHWGGAANGEVKRLMLAHAFEWVDTVRFHVGPRNIRSQRAVEKLGAVREEDDPRGWFVYRLDATA